VHKADKLTILKRRPLRNFGSLKLLGLEGFVQACNELALILIYLLTAIGLSPGGSTHLHTNNTQNNTNNNRTTQMQTNVKECGPCPVFASFTLAFALQLRKKHGETSVRVRKTSVRLRKTPVKVQYTVIFYKTTRKINSVHHNLYNSG